jgi:hypothetical protein
MSAKICSPIIVCENIAWKMPTNIRKTGRIPVSNDKILKKVAIVFIAGHFRVYIISP